MSSYSAEAVANHVFHVFVNPELVRLRVSNPHFNPVTEYDYLLRWPNKELFKSHLLEQITTSLAEDFAGTGRYSLRFFPQTDGSYFFSNSSFKDRDLIETAERNVELNLITHQPINRELGELNLVSELRQQAIKAPESAIFTWTSPPGDESKYPDRISITYVCQVKGKPEELDTREVDVRLIVHNLSLEGHKQYIKSRDRSIIPEMSDAWFVGQLLPINTKDDFEKVVQDTQDNIKQIQDKGLINPEANLNKFLEEQVFYQAKPQIEAFIEFFASLYLDIYSRVGKDLHQGQVDLLERAYSLGYRSVKKYLYSSKPEVVSADTLLKDFNDLENIRNTARNRELLREWWYWYVSSFNSMMEARYGDLNAMETGGAGCPMGMLPGLGSELSGPVLYDFTKPSGINEPILDVMECVTCPICNKSGVNGYVTPTRIICSDCGKFVMRS